MNKEKLEILLPLLNDYLFESDWELILSYFVTKGLALKDYKKTSRRFSNARGIIQSLNLSDGKKSAEIFCNAIKETGKLALSTIVFCFFQSNENVPLNWIIHNWIELQSCAIVLDGQKFKFLEVKTTECLTKDKWLILLKKVGNPEHDSKFAADCVDQLQKLLNDSQKVLEKKLKLEVCGWKKSLQVLDFVIDQTLDKDHFIGIASAFRLRGLIAKDEFHDIETSENICSAFLKVIDETCGPNCIEEFILILQTEGYMLLSEIIELYFCENNLNLLWFAIHSPEIAEKWIPVLGLACQYFKISVPWGQPPNITLLQIMLKAATGDDENTKLFMHAVCELFKNLNLNLKFETNNCPHPENIYLQFSCKMPQALHIRTQDHHNDGISNNQRNIMPTLTDSLGWEDKKEKNVDDQKSYKYFTRLQSKKENSTVMHDKSAIDVESLQCNPKDCEGSANPETTASTGSFDLKPAEIFLQFRLLIDRKSNPPDERSYFVYVDGWDEVIAMKCYDKKKRLFTAEVWLRNSTHLVYKYYSSDQPNSKTWERLPGGEYGLVNRKVQLKQNRVCSGDVIFFDVATFDRPPHHIAMHSFQSMFSRNIKNHLPDISLLECGNLETNEMSLSSYFKLLDQWWYGNKIEFDRNSFIGDNIPTCTAEFSSYITSDLSKIDAYRRILACLAITTVLHQHNVTFRKPEPMKEICLGLSIGDLDKSQLEKLYDQVFQCESPLHEQMLSSLKFIMKMETSMKCLLAVPVYYILANKGDCSFNAEVWESISSQIHFDELRQHAEFNPNSVVDITPQILSLSKLFPQLIEVFQSLLPCSAILHLLNTGNEMIKHLHPGNFLKQLLQEAQLDYSKYIESKRFLSWIGEYMDQLVESYKDQSIASLDERKAFITELNQAAVKFLAKIDFSLVKRKWIGRFLTITSKLQYCSFRTIENQYEISKKRVPQFEALLKIVYDWMMKDNDPEVKFTHIEFWNCIFSIDFMNEELKKMWLNKMERGLQEIMLKKFKRTEVSDIKIVLDRLDRLEASESIKSCCYEAICQLAVQSSEDTGGFYKRLKSIFSGNSSEFVKFSPILCRMFLDKWRLCSGRDMINKVLKFFLQHRFPVHFFKLFDEKQNKKQLDKNIVGIMAVIKSQLHIIRSNLLSGEILFGQLELICAKRNAFAETLGILEDDSGSSVDNLSSPLEKRLEEMKAFCDLQSCCQNFLSSDISCFDLSQLDATLKHDFSSTPWCKMIDCQSEKPDVNVTAFQLPDDVKTAICEIFFYQITGQETLHEIWKSEVDKYCDSKFDRNKPDLLSVDSITIVWQATKERICKLKHEIRSGNVFLCEVDLLFEKHCNEPALEDRIKSFMKAAYAFPDFSPTFADPGSSTSYELSQDQKSEDATFVDAQEYTEDNDDIEEESSSVSIVAEDQQLEVFHETQSSALALECLEEPTSQIETLAETTVLENVHESDPEVSELESLAEDDTHKAIKDTVEDPEFKDDDECMKYRVTQIFNYFSLKNRQEIASLLLELKTSLELKGDFTCINVVQEHKNMSVKKPLKYINRSIIDASAALKDVNMKQAGLIRGFIENQSLITWLRENMKDRREVKVMSDLAMISAGESTIEVDRVSCFLSAVMGFAPFIFDLGENANLQDALNEFKKVSEASEPEKLLQQWNATAQYLEWLKGIKDFHGSVEKSSLARAQDINNSGIYVIGGEDEKIVSVENALKLSISTKSDEEIKPMSMSELKNLQSRLMLIAGEADKGLDDVKFFIEILSHVENLTKAYVKLKVSGCLLFNNWTATIRVSPGKNGECEVAGSIEVRFDTDSIPILCKDDLISEMKNLTAVMESAHERWKLGLSKMRNEFYHLNHYNIQQVIYLCKKLALVNQGDVIPDQVFTLLALIKSDVSEKEIMTLLRDTVTTTDNEVEEIEDENVSENEEPTELSAIEQKKKMVKRLADDYPETLAKAAVQANKLPLDYDECYMKALELEGGDDDEIDELVKEFDKEAGFDASTSEINVIRSVVNDRSNLSLQAVIAKIQDNQTEGCNSASVAVKTACERYANETSVTSLSDCISIEHLGAFLGHLSNKIERKHIPQRKLPSTLEPGKPNLIICPENDMFSTLLSIYMHSPLERLPDLSEVLLCSESTTKEEAELFLRRAMILHPNTGASVYCLAFADKLSFEIANATESMIKQLEKDPSCNSSYNLVVLCTYSQHFLASLLFESKVEYSLRNSPSEIQRYLADHLKVDDHISSRLEDELQGNTSVLVVSSHRAGLGKSLHIKRRSAKLLNNTEETIVRLLDKQLSEDDIMERLFYSKKDFRNKSLHFVHFDVTPSVQEGISRFLFNLLVLGGFKDSIGTLWLRQPCHLYCIEYTNRTAAENNFQVIPLEQHLLNLLPSVKCISPREILNHKNEGPLSYVVMMDHEVFSSITFQRPYQYLLRYSKGENLDGFSYQDPGGSPNECIQTLLDFCSVENPTWSELRHFASFLNSQLSDCERSIFCNAALMGADSGLSGFKNFVVRFMIRMSQDFATPSLEAADGAVAEMNAAVFELHQLRRRWEEDAHPYLFFNEDGISMTFINFRVDQRGNLLHPKDPLKRLETNLIDPKLIRGLNLQKVNLNEDFDTLSRNQKLLTLCRVMGLKESLDHDPDPTYELTTDNVLKMLAIHMRFRCGIPVVIMGETGCGKTRMVEFMSKLKAGSHPHAENMVIVKVHGGITVQTIQDEMEKALTLARENKQNYNIDTMLFLDEANTTEAIYAIKEFVCDGTVHGKVHQETSLRIVCACNPYRKHSDEAIKAMAEAGLGFRVKMEDTTDKLGKIPMRCLVYRVIALPPSMQPLVWDFGQLSSAAEKVYIQQMVSKLCDEKSDSTIKISSPEINTIVSVLCSSQNYMREQRQQCMFVSLRDVERCLQSFVWFYQNRLWLYRLIDKEREKDFPTFSQGSRIVIRTLLQAIGMCYHVTLESRNPYREVVSRCLSTHGLPFTHEDILEEITACQKVFINNIDLEENIARNEALRENVFMMIMCTEMRIPLFLIGKPGSSKSLAKTIVTDAMQGQSSRNDIFHKLKQIHILSFQCSAVSDAVGIEAVFSQCAKVQLNQNPDKFVSVVVLDEVGLAEDSPKMPLKVLHPLLEGSITNEMKKHDHETSSQNKIQKVGFVGISNWALDPAKMNRGIFVHRGDPTEDDLKLTAEGIFSSDQTNLKLKQFKDLHRIVDTLTASYLEIRKKQDQEFFGLRDYYGLLKMVFAVVDKDNEPLNYLHVADAVKRNFSGGKIDCFGIFLNHLKQLWPKASISKTSLKKMITDNLDSVNDCESRFLLLLSNRFAAVNLLNQIVDCSKFQVIFGSSFPQDNDYTELCRNINKIKICMESGCTVVLLNLRDLYESLYDALNQHYVTFAGQRYVDLGLGGHRVKCRVAHNFRLIVIEDKDVVYDEFPIPLINRLEKYIFTTESILDSDNCDTVQRMNMWVKNFSEIDIPLHKQRIVKQFKKKECFIGYVEDSAASALLSVVDEASSKDKAQLTLLHTATIDSVFRLPQSKLKKEAKKLQQIYFEHSHDNLVAFLKNRMSSAASPVEMFEITSFSQILSEHDRRSLETVFDLQRNSVMLLTLQQFQTQEEYNCKVETFFSTVLEKCYKKQDEPLVSILFIQCPQAESHSNLIACAKYSVKNMIQHNLQQIANEKCHVFIVFLYTIERQGGQPTSCNLQSFHSSDCVSLYVDALRPSVDYVGPPSKFWNKTISEVLEESKLHLHASQNTCRLIDPRYLLDPDLLIRSCISGATIKLKNSVESVDEQQRNRVKILQFLCSEECPISIHFVNILFGRIIQLLKDRDNAIMTPESWTLQEASQHESLHEGGTFSKTLWLKLKKVVTLAMAKILSIVDEDDNLDLIKNEESTKLCNLWLKMFRDEKICKFSWKDVFVKNSLFEVRHKRDFKCHFPFSRQVIDCFHQIWSFLPSNDVSKKLTEFYYQIQSSEINTLLVEEFRNGKIQLLNYFIHDVVKILYQPSTDGNLEYKLLEGTLLSMFAAQLPSNSLQGNHAATIYTCFMISKPQISQLSALIEIMPNILTEENVDRWTEEQKEHSEMIVQVLVYQCILKEVEHQFDNLIIPDGYHQWRSLVVQVINMDVYRFLPLENVELKQICSDITNMHKAIAFVELFLNMLVPEHLAPKVFKQYLEFLVPLSKTLWKGAKMRNLNSAQFLNIVMGILRKYLQNLTLNFLLGWKDFTCKLCKKRINNPVILPCNHYFCLDCIRLCDTSDIRRCPLCRQSFSDEFSFTPAKLTEQQSKQLEDFKINCTSFFLEYLSTLCFPTSEMTSSEITVDKDFTDILQNLVICKKSTRAMTPVDMETFDETPTVRSFILQLLLRHSPEDTQDVLENHFMKVGEVLDDKRDLMLMYIRCIEDSLRTKADVVETKDGAFMKQLIDELEEYFEADDEPKQIEILDVVAKLRYIMREAAKLVQSIQRKVSTDEDVDEEKSLLSAICALLQDNDLSVAKQYFVKILCRQYGFGSFNQLSQNGEFSALIPQELNPENSENKFAHKTSLFLLGEEYASTQHMLLNMADENEEVTKKLCEKAAVSSDVTLQILHGILAWTSTASTLQTKTFKKNFFDKIMERLEALAELDNNLISCFRNMIHQEIAIPQMATDEFHILQEFVMVVASTIFSTSGTVLDDLKSMVNNPHNIQSLFLPTMPQSGYFDVKDIVSTLTESYNKPPKPYLCPKGHVYYIGDCTNPNETSICPECHQPIGAARKGHTELMAGNKAGDLSERSQAGYLLGKPQNRPLSATPERSCSRLIVCVLRLFLHATLLHASKIGNNINNYLGLEDSEDVAKFLFGHLQIDFKQLSDCLGKSADDTALLLHQVMKEIRLKKNVVRNFEANLNSMNGRNKWELDFHRCFLVQILLNSDEKIEEARNVCLSLQKQDDLERLVFEMPEDRPQNEDEDVAEEGVVSWKSPFLWKYQVHVTVAHLRQRLEGIVDQDEYEGQTLKLILNETDLSIIQHLPQILLLQKMMIQRFQRKADMNDVDEMSIRQYTMEEDRTVSDETLQLYIDVWNAVKGNLPHPNAYGTSLDNLREEMNFASPVSMCLPCKAGRGSCALALTEYIIEKQNNLLFKCRNLIKPTPTFSEVSLQHLSPYDVVCIDNDRNLMPLILANSQYEVSVGQTGTKHQISYRIAALEKQVVEKFILNKKMLKKETLPCHVYLQDMGIGAEVSAMKENVPQVRLPHKIYQKLDEIFVKARLPDVCEGVRTLTLVISYLAKLKNDPEKLLIKYVTDDLMISPGEALMIPKAAQLKHTLGLYERLSWQRSVRFVVSGQDPYANIRMQDELEEVEDVGSVEEFFKQVKIPRLQLELNSLILLMESLNPHSSLKDNLYVFLEEKHDDDDDAEECVEWCNKLPENLKILHAPHLFKLSLHFAD